MNISLYKNKYREQVQSICMASYEGAASMASAIQTVFCDSYLDLTPNTCMVLLDEEDSVFGYILSALNSKEWKTKQMNYLNESNSNPLSLEMAKGANFVMNNYSEEYQAHFHIQIKEEARGNGYGSMLLHCIEEHVRNNDINGIMCNVSISNKKAQAFYRRNGYVEIGRDDYEIAMGKILFGRKKK